VPARRLAADASTEVAATLRVTAPNGDEWLVVTTIVDDPQYLSQTFITSSNFKKLPDSTGWTPTPCLAK